jgi:ribosome-interacting GTPase 1
VWECIGPARRGPPGRRIHADPDSNPPNPHHPPSGIIEGAKDGKGRGRQVISAARTCNIILVVLDVAKPATHKILIERELDGFGIRLNQEPPRIMFRKKEKGGINYQAFVPQSTLDSESVAAICKEYRIHNADVHLRCDATVDQVRA